MNDVDFPVADVLRGIEAAHAAGLGPIKVNMVVKRGTNEHEILPMARHFKGSGIVLRFIEYMDVGATNGWRMDEVMPSAEVVRLHPPRTAAGAAGPSRARRNRRALGLCRRRARRGEIGVISSVTQAFCRDCNRARLSTEGKLYLCLFATQGHDLRTAGARRRQRRRTGQRHRRHLARPHDRYSELRASLPPDQRSAGGRRIEMSYIGG
jgi:GTP 3',8-cyclase